MIRTNSVTLTEIPGAIAYRVKLATGGAGIVIVRMALTVLIGRDMKEADEFVEAFEKMKEEENVVEDLMHERAVINIVDEDEDSDG